VTTFIGKHTEATSPSLKQAVYGSTQDSILEVDEHQRHGFKVGNLRLLMPIGIVCEVSRNSSICSLPNSPNYLLGMVNLRGNIAPVMDFVKLFSINKPTNLDKNYLFFQLENEWIGIVINGLPETVSLPPQYQLDRYPAMPWDLKPFVTNCFQKEHTWFECDLDAIFSWIKSQVHNNFEQSIS